VTPWLGWDGTDSAVTPDAGNYGSGDYGGLAPAPGDASGPYPPPYDPNQIAPQRPVYRGATEPEQAPAPESEDAVTLVFKDGRPPEQIHNYILSRTTLYVQDKRTRSIPIEQLDVAATAKANEDAGIEFRLPSATP
jgi:hypothetical protein